MQFRSFAVAAAALLAPALALAWTSNAPFQATVHGHEFKRVEAGDEGCSIAAKLKFTAPESGYKEPAAVRNYYRFKARLRFASGKQALSPTFFSRKPGNHEFEFRFDTQSGGCWAKREQKVIGVDVEGCRGEGCRVQPFE